MFNINVLVLFETSGAVSVPFREYGFNVTTVDILPHKVDNINHIMCDVNELFNIPGFFDKYDVLIAFPPCTYFSKAGLHWLYKQPGRYDLQSRDLQLVKRLWSLPIKFKCFENPGSSALNKLFMPCSCKIDYCNYADFKKRTDLWLSNLPCLLPDFINVKKYGKFITRLNGYKRSITPIEVGYSMVRQWGSIIEKGVLNEKLC